MSQTADAPRGAKAVPPDVLAVLDRAVLDGPTLRLAGQIDRALYMKTAGVIEAAGGRWDKKAKAHVFPGEAAAAIEPILLTGKVTNDKQAFGQFDTPPDLVSQLIALAGIRPGMDVLEPSAGLGNIAVEIIRAGGRLLTYEIDPARNAKLILRIARLHKEEPSVAAALCRGSFGDFLAAEPRADFDRVIMNPPFALQADIDHVMHAARFLRPGGRLVAIMSAGVGYRENRKALGFRDFIKAVGGTIEQLPAASFRASGTDVNACLVTFGAAP